MAGFVWLQLQPEFFLWRWTRQIVPQGTVNEIPQGRVFVGGPFFGGLQEGIVDINSGPHTPKHISQGINMPTAPFQKNRRRANSITRAQLSAVIKLAFGPAFVHLTGIPAPPGGISSL